MARLIVKGLFAESEKATDAGPKDFRASIKETVREFNGTVTEFRYLKGVVTCAVLPDDVADKVADELKKNSIPVTRVKTALEGFKTKHSK